MARFLGLGTGATGAVNLSTYTPIAASCSGTLGATSLSATGSFVAGQRLFICQMSGTGVGAYEDNYVGSYTSGTITLIHPLENTYTDSGASQAQVVVVPEATSVTGTLTQTAWAGNTGGLTVIACNGTFSGTINATGKGYRGGARGWSYGANQTGQQGEGTTGTGSQAITANSSGGGGGGAAVPINSSGNPAGGGGYGAAGSNGVRSDGTNLGVGGQAVGQAELTSLYMGGGGGGGGCGDANPTQSATFGIGANGGGIIVVYASTISSTASLLSNGADSTDYAIEDQHGGGGGAGGSILIKCQNITIGSNLITASGGSGGMKLTYGGNSGYGGDGAVGRIRIEPCSVSGTTTPTASLSTGGHNYCSILGGVI